MVDLTSQPRSPDEETASISGDHSVPESLNQSINTEVIENLFSDTGFHFMAATNGKGRKRMWDEESTAEDLEADLPPNPPPPVTLPSLPAIIIPAPITTLPGFKTTFKTQRKEGGDKTERFLLFRIAKKHNMEWAILGQASTEAGELGRPPTTAQPDQILFSSGAAVDILSAVNSHLNIPSYNSIPPDFQKKVRSAGRKAAQPRRASGFNPIPMSRYSSEASEWASFLDSNPVVPPVLPYPPPAYPRVITDTRIAIKSHLEGITALNILRNLPEDEVEDRLAIINLLASLHFSGIRRQSEALGEQLRDYRAMHLAEVDPATREELVNQPIWSNQLYTDLSPLATVNVTSPVPTGNFLNFPRRPLVVETPTISPVYSDITPPIRFYPTQDPQGGGLDLSSRERELRPSGSNDNSQDGRQSH